MGVSGWQSIAAGQLNASNVDAWPGARHASKDMLNSMCDARSQ
jgi:hypothetical protein